MNQSNSTSYLTKETSLHKLARFQQLFIEKGDTKSSLKAEKLAEKIYDGDFLLAFCGHFSAGKSSMINFLMGEEILPSSPIPTSANLVKIHRTEEDFAKIHYHHDTPLLFQAPFDFDEVKSYCKNGEEVYSIEMGHSRSSLPEGVTVLDTPGVDSTDDAHRLSTESAIHLADIVFYVMDYNHVQSQLNFEFTKELLKHGVELYLIINQIDKHKEEELSFEKYKKGVQEAFASWGVEPNGFFFTSLRDLDHANNEIKKVKNLIDTKIKNKEELMNQSFQSSLSQLKKEHQNWFDEQIIQVKEETTGLLTENDWLESDTVLEKEQELITKINSLDVRIQEKKLKEEREKILNNAYLMPFETREKAKLFLESQQSGFKVGFLFSKGKTEEEKRRRLNAFLTEVQQRVESQLEWHLKTMGKNFLKDSKLASSSEYALTWDELTILVDEELLIGLVRSGALVNGEAVLNYCEEVANKLKTRAKKTTDELFAEPLRDLEKQNDQDQRIVVKELELVKDKADVLRKGMELEEEKMTVLTALENVTTDDSENYVDWVKQWEERWKQERANVRIGPIDTDSSEKEVRKDTQQLSPVENEMEHTNSPSVEEVSDKLQTMINVMEPMRAFTQMTNMLRGKMTRLQNQSFTIALFGAFSAGKSSFANALLGKKVLPVSPNPTTAAINRIRPVGEGNKHETADVQLKTSKQMLDDISQSLSHFDITVGSLEEAYEKIPSLHDYETDNGKEKIHLSFLKAFYEGYKNFHNMLGNRITVDMEEYKGFVAEEEKSCFVETIDLYYDCFITRQGITLVDTPGADSINARHTGVAFEYIRNSDAIIFVTYYNHAFAKADREFLIQLGRVKDSFELDKMFFVVNAIDLAKDEEESQEVLDYVENQLHLYGIRFPRLHGVSSIQALQKETRENSKIDYFLNGFHDFIEHELVSISVQSGLTEWHRGLKRLQQYIEMASGDEKERIKKQEALIADREELTRLFEKTSFRSIQNENNQELSELLLYVKQRVFFRLADFFKEAFHPGLFAREANKKKALQEATEEFVSSMGFDFAQEMRATSLRIEQFAQKSLSQSWSEYAARMTRINDDLLLSPMEFISPSVMEFETAFTQLEPSYFQEALSYYKSAKDFFEKGGKKNVQEKFERLLQSPADNYLDVQKQRVVSWSEEYISTQHDKMVQELLQQAIEQVDASIEALQSIENIDKLKEEYHYLLSLNKGEESID
jgi:predicted GTPase